MFRTLPLLLAISTFATLLFSCEKDPEIITKTVVETDTLYVTIQDTVIQTVTDTLTLTELIHDTATTFILLRHAETTGVGSDPVLSADGEERAGELVRVLQGVDLAAVYSSNFNRTKLTAQALAADNGLTTEIYNATSMEPLADAVLAAQRGKAVVVVGHSNTIPTLLNLLTGTNDFGQIPETQYDNLYVVTVAEKGRATVVHLRYGKPTP